MSKHEVMMASLTKYYSATPDALRMLTDILKGSSRVSLRLYDWLCTNYSKSRNVTYLLGAEEDTHPLNLYLSYKANLKAYSKRHFDPFQRRERVQFNDADGETFTTTVGQLAFFRWVFANKVHTYAQAHTAEIEKDMLASIRHRYDGTPPSMKNKGTEEAAPGLKLTSHKRNELSKAAIKSCTSTSIKVTVRWT